MKALFPIMGLLWTGVQQASVASASAPAFEYVDARTIAQIARDSHVPTPPLKPAPFHAGPYDKAYPSSMPAIGKWMLDSKGRVAHWLGWPYGHLRMDEPINVIIRIRANTMRDAVTVLRGALDKTDFAIRSGHSGGYQAYLGAAREPLPQFPSADSTFSDKDWAQENNHGRLFGPIRSRGFYYVIGAFSRESAARGPRSFHMFLSFNQARDEFKEQMRDRAGARIGNSVPLVNAIPKDQYQVETTVDCDGSAVLIDL